ncbi:MAG: hypothetical protein C0600_14015 [Ignavibacteria bacterium]|nr:MAG: hypothetical protein C0600_14015 [Ignavibacteria bacterium]
MTLPRPARVAAICMLIAAVAPWTTLQAQDALLDVMASEIKREMETLQAQNPPAYFLSYRINHSYTCSISTEFGALEQSRETKGSNITTQIRVGDHTMDNTREIRGSGGFDFSFPQFTSMPLDGDETATRLLLWNETNKQYRKASKKYQEVKANTAVKVEAEDQSADFANDIRVESYIDPPVDIDAIKPDISRWEQRLKRISREFLACDDMFEGTASLTFEVARKRIATSEGSKIAENRVSARVMLRAKVKCDDGMELQLHRSYFAFDHMKLPDEKQMIADAREMVATLKAMRQAPVIEPYVGPALLSGEASGVFFHEIFGHRVEGHRQKKESEGQTFKKKEGEEVLPVHMSVTFDPTLKSFSGIDLNGHYVFDDEGVRGNKVGVVENGVLRDFLMSRTPFDKHPTSNGHGRAQAGYTPVSRQSNMIVATSNPRTEQKLRDLLLEECRAQNRQFGLYFKDVQGGFTMTGRFVPNAFNVTPTEVYRVYVDGRPDELVRGVDLVGTPLVMFSNITDAGDIPAVFTGTCGAESGGVPVSAASPALLVSQIEVQKKEKSQERAPILPRPDIDNQTQQPSN